MRLSVSLGAKPLDGGTALLHRPRDPRMLVRAIESLIDRSTLLQKVGERIQQPLHQALHHGPEPLRKLADVLHGKGSGHPLHPVLTDITIGAWTLGFAFDCWAAWRGDEWAERTADQLTAIGTASAIPTSLTGLADYAGAPKPAHNAATLHALMNDVNIGLYLASLAARRRGDRRQGVLLSATAIGLTTAAAWVGGHLVYRKQVGTDHSTSPDGPTSWTPAIADRDLEPGAPQRVTVDGAEILLYRADGRIYAMGAVCSHAGAPLENGTFDHHTVTCPWHNSVFDLRDGAVEHGPAVHPQPRFETRLRDGQVEVRFVEE